MRSFDRTGSGDRWWAWACTALAVLLLSACAPSVTTPGRALPDCEVSDGGGNASRRAEFDELRRNVERGALFQVAVLSLPATCRGQIDAAGSIRVDYRFADGSALKVQRQSLIETTDFNLRLARPSTTPVHHFLAELERTAFGAAGCGIDWQRPTTEPAADGIRGIDTVYRGDVCNCQPRVRRDDQGRAVALALRSAC